MTVSRGEVYLVSLPGQTKPRPAVVLTADWLSEYALDVTVAPLTSVARSNFPTRVEVSVGEGDVRIRSWIKCDQLTTIPKAMLAGRAFGKLSSKTLLEVERAVRLALNMTSSRTVAD
jgi:mRNA-degrading endonuclease toxin of MazEF toxin-antitoxin module